MPSKIITKKVPALKAARAKINKVTSENINKVTDQGDAAIPPISRVRRVSERDSKVANLTKFSKNDNLQPPKTGKAAENNNSKVSGAKKARKVPDGTEKVPKKNSNATKEQVHQQLSISDLDGKENEPENKSKVIKPQEELEVFKQETAKSAEVPEAKNISASSDHSNSTVRNGSSSETGKMFVGAHVSASGGLHNAVNNAVAMKAKSFALFLRSQRSWNSKPLDPEIAAQFAGLCELHGYSPNHILPHGSYLVNLGSPKQELREKSFNLLKEELERCRELGLNMFNIHPGSSCGEISKEMCIEYIAEGINRVLEVTSGVKVVLENMSGQGHTIGGDFRELGAIIEKVDDKSRVGVCLDTCHAMAAGYDLSRQQGFDAFIKCFSEQVGFEWLVGVHLNDSKGPAGCNKDIHENIGKGTIGKEGFMRIMNCQHFADLPLILETPCENNEMYEKEIELLEGLIEKRE